MSRPRREPVPGPSAPLLRLLEFLSEADVTLRSTVLSCALLLTACDAPVATAPSDGGLPVSSETPTPHAYRLEIPISPELRTAGGEVSLLRLPNEGALARETHVVAAGTESLAVMVTNTESIAVTQSSNDVARSVDVAQPGCGDPAYSTGVVLRVPDDFATIQAAIDAASPGDTVAVGPGVFTEFLSMRPGVRLRGSGAGRTVLDAMGHPRNLIDLTRAPGVVISGFTFRGVPRADIGCSLPTTPSSAAETGTRPRSTATGTGSWSSIPRQCSPRSIRPSTGRHARAPSRSSPRTSSRTISWP